MRIFEHNFSDNKEKGRRHTVVCQVLLTQLAEKFAKKTHFAKILNRLLKCNAAAHCALHIVLSFAVILSERSSC